MQRREFRAFVISLLTTLLLILLFLGIAVVDYECRKIGFGDEKTLIYQITGKNLNFACNSIGICYNY
jgi:heme/copper-type cytochrome/quinol oxidase subunit 3